MNTILHWEIHDNSNSFINVKTGMFASTLYTHDIFNKNIQNIDIAKKLIAILKNNSNTIGNKVKIKFVKDRPGHDFRYALDCKKIHRELKWKSRINLNEGLADTFQWYLNNMDFFISVSKKLYDKRLGLK